MARLVEINGLDLSQQAQGVARVCWFGNSQGFRIFGDGRRSSELLKLAWKGSFGLLYRSLRIDKMWIQGT